ncbi:hypothetical protein BX600DRAFT_128544 [Xylariales sp. PMI_506]|nr:hypothetical protein BX600DRAFT_128544 [Xylariales sp. PMI_506]
MPASQSLRLATAYHYVNFPFAHAEFDLVGCTWVGQDAPISVKSYLLELPASQRLGHIFSPQVRRISRGIGVDDEVFLPENPPFECHLFALMTRDRAEWSCALGSKLWPFFLPAPHAKLAECLGRGERGEGGRMLSRARLTFCSTGQGVESLWTHEFRVASIQPDQTACSWTPWDHQKGHFWPTHWQ